MFLCFRIGIRANFSFTKIFVQNPRFMGIGGGGRFTFFFESADGDPKKQPFLSHP